MDLAQMPTSYSERVELNIKKPRVWNLAEATLFVSSMQQDAHNVGFNLSIGGGVINSGFSLNDLDLVAVARTKITSQHLSALLHLFQVREFYMEPRRSKTVYVGDLYGAERHDGKMIELLVIRGR